MKRYLKFIVTIMILLSILVALSGCGIKNDVKTMEEKIRRELEETTENEAEESDDETDEVEDNKKTQTKKEKTVEQKPVDKTPVDIKLNSSYYFVVNGKKYNVGDKISSLSESNLKLNSTGGEKELQKNGYLIGGGAVLNSEKKTVFNITPYNNGQSKVKAADTVIGGFSLDKYGYNYLSGNVEICNGITIGTSIDDVKTVFGEPTKTTEGTEYRGPTYTYDAKSNYMQFTFAFDKDGKIERISWQNFNLN